MYYGIERIRRTYRAILLQMIQDIASESKKVEVVGYKREARNWLKSPDFIVVCELADYDPDYVRRKIDEAANRNFQWRKPNSTTGRR